MEKRAWNRQPLDIHARYSSTGLPEQPCRVRDFCPGGILVGCENSVTDLLTLGEELRVRFSSTDLNGKLHVYQIRTVIRRISDKQIGTAFKGDPTSEIKAVLEREAARYREEEMALGGAVRVGETDEGAVEAATEAAISTLQPLLQEFMPKLNDALLAKASEAQNNTEQSAYFESMQQFTKFGKAFADRIAKKVEAGMRDPGARVIHEKPDEETDNSSLSLVDQSEFEDWLLVSNTASRLEDHYKDPLSRLNDGLEIAHGLKLDSQRNPIGPSAICEAFRDAVQPAITSDKAKAFIFQEFESKLDSELTTLYTKVMESLEQSGVKDRIEERERERRQQRKDAAKAREHVYKPDEDEAAPEPAEQASADAAPDESVSQPGDAATGVPQQGQTGGAHAGFAGGVPGGYAGGAPGGAGGHGGFAGGVPGGAGVPGGFAGGAPGGAGVPGGFAGGAPGGAGAPGGFAGGDSGGGVTGAGGSLSVDQIIERLTSLQTTQSAQAQIESSDQIAQWLSSELEGGGEVALAPEQRMPMDATDAMFNQIFKRELHNEGMRPWLKKLRVPLLKTMMQDPDLSEHKSQSARQVINQLARLSSANLPGSAGLQSTLENFAEKIVNEHDQRPEVFEEILEQVTPLVERQSKAYLRNLERDRKLRQGQEKLHRARTRVGQELQDRVGNRPIPTIFKRLVEHGWRDLLVLVLLSEGEKSSEWSDYTSVLDLLLDWLKPAKVRGSKGRLRDFASHVERAMGILRKGFETSSTDRLDSDGLIKELEDVLLDRSEDLDDHLKLEYLDPEFLKPTPPWTESESASSGAGKKDPAQWTRRIGRLSAGDCLVQDLGEGESRRMQLMWVAPDQSRYAFVDEYGIETQQLRAEELATELASGKTRIASEDETKGMDGKVLSTVQNVYEDLSQKVTHDELTGLVNRKELERRLDKAVLASKRETVYHVACFLDLDQFKVINNNLGHSVGDRLLIEISSLLQEKVPEGATLARYDGDGFAVLLPDTKLRPAQEIASFLHQAVSNHKFRWGPQEFKLTASLGLVEITPYTENVDAVLRGGEQACYMAKEAGRDRIRVFEESDEMLVRKRASMDWIGRISQAIEEDLFRLRVQRIVPLQGDAPKAHSELLLSITQNGKTIDTPGELIQAAEAYNRMASIDTWLIRHSIAWMARNPKIVEKLGGLAINLSGQSICDDELLTMLFEELSISKIPPKLLCFEVTENSVVANLESAMDFIEEVKAIGCTVVLNNFGSGLSSYSHLKDLPVDLIKIDGSFIRNISTTPSDQAMVKSINEIAHFLGKKTIAKHVDNRETIKTLRDIGVDYLQGQVIKKPVFLDELAK